MIVGPGALPPEEAGGKAAGLARLLDLGLPVPPALVVPASARGRFEEDPEEIARRLGEPLAVRSSAVGEDAADRSAAGQYQSLMGVTAQGLTAAVERIHRSAFSDRARAYGRDDEIRMAVVIQHQVAATRAGVAFSRDPVTGDEAMLVECVFGHGERLVSGTASPDRYRLDPGGEIQARLAVKGGPHRLLRTLRDDEVLTVATSTRQAEAGFGCPVDVEFCFEGAKLWLVQCRPITTL